MGLRVDDQTGAAASAPLRTGDVAGKVGYSVQQVRDLERLGVIPPAARASNGYRHYTDVHLAALRAYQGIASAAGPDVARALLTQLRASSIAGAATAMNALHVRLAAERDEAMRAHEALNAIEAEATLSPQESDADAMTITGLADALGVRASTLRFWEEEGLVDPERVTSLRARRYGVDAIRAARIVAALRSSRYSIPAVRAIVTTLHHTDGMAEARRILQGRLDRITTRTTALLRAGTDLASVIESPRK